jgi:O-antigen/teichoic acid export membrane protein
MFIKGRDKIASVLMQVMQLIHHIVIGGIAGKNMTKFAKQLSVTIVSGVGVFVVLFMTNVLVARMLGPEEYGRYAIIFSVAQIMTLFFTLELDVSALYFLTGNTTQDNKKIVSSIMIMFFINVAVFSFLAVSIFQFFDASRALSQEVFIGALFIAFVYAWKRLTDAFLRTQELFTIQAILRIIEAIIICMIVVILFYFAHIVTAGAYIFAIICGGVIFAFFGMIAVRSIMSVRRGTVAAINEIFHYNSYGLINATINGIVKNVDTLLIAMLLGVQMAGIYAVYFTAVVVFGARMTQMVMSVFFPAVRMQQHNIMLIHQKITTMMKRTCVLLSIAASGGIACVILVYGDQYPFVWQWVVLGGIYISVHFFASLYGWLLSSISPQGYRQYNVSYFFGFVVYCVVIGVAYMLGIFSITSMIIAMILYRAVGGVIAFYDVRRRGDAVPVDNSPKK